MLSGREGKGCLLAPLSPKWHVFERHISQMCSKKRELSLPVCLRQSSDCAIYPMVVCVPSFQEQGIILRSLSHPSLSTSITPVLSLAGCKILEKSALLVFSAIDSGEVFFLHVPLYAPLSATFLHDQSSFSSVVPMIHSSPKSCLWTSYLSWWGLFFLLVVVVCSALRLIYWVLRTIWWLSSCVWETRQTYVLLPHHHLNSSPRKIFCT